jgi:hypothetical protein
MQILKQMLKKLVAVGLFILMVQSSAWADLLSPNMAGGDAISRIKSLETKEGVSAQFWLTSDEQIFAGWMKTGMIRSLKPISEVKRNTPVYFALFLANPGVRRVVKANALKPKLSSDITFDLFLVTPSGNVCLADRQKVAWRGVPPAPELVYLAKDRGVISFEAIDPLGEYTVIVVLHDNVLKMDMKLSRKLVLTD